LMYETAAMVSDALVPTLGTHDAAWS
jgi:hypothetical protein